jgi:RHS repeat-associated protein
MKTAKVGSSTTTYYYNALGQRIKKTGGSAGTVLMMYDEAGHILGEYSSTGALVQETVWMGDIPVATIRPSGSSVAIYYVHADHLNAPRIVTQPSTNDIVWRWDTDPFGTAAPNQNPAGLGTFVYNLRYPGQYYDSETGLNYNYFRDYDPATGRYVESDPIGLRGGINTYSYAYSNPVNLADPMGLFSVSPATIEQALARAGLAEAAGLGPEDPAADVAAALAIIATIVTASDTPSNVIPFPTKPATSNSCPPDDGCERDQKLLMGQRLVLTNMLAARTVSIADYAQKANAFNQRAATHNARCPKNKVAPVPLGPRGV